MRCRPGDLAVTVGSIDGRQDGRLVEVLRAATPMDVTEWEPGSWYVKAVGEPLFMVGRDGKVHRFRYCALRDSNLRPIRDQPGEDESLTWKEVPKPSVLTPRPQKEFAR